MSGPIEEQEPPWAGRKLDLRHVLRRTFSTWWALLGPCSALTVLVRGPFVVAQVVLPEPAVLAQRGTSWALAALLGLLVDMLTPALLSGALTFAVFRHLRGQVFEPWHSLRIGLRHFVPVLAVGVVSSLLTVLGCCLFVIPGLAAIATYSIAVPCSVIERLGVRATLRRCAELTAGTRFEVFGVVLAVAVFGMLGNAGANGLTRLLTHTLDPTNSLAMSIEGTLALAALLFQGIAIIAPTLVYHDLRMARTDVTDLVKVFE